MNPIVCKKASHAAIILILALLLSAWNWIDGSTRPIPISAVPIAGSWTGTTSRSQPMSFTVSGSQWNTFVLKTDFVIGACSGTMEITVPGPGSISSDQFSYTSSTYSFTGQFTSPSTASGTYSFVNRNIVGCGYLTQSGTWTASIPIPPPGAFSKSGPANGVVDQVITPTLTWNSSSNAEGYEYCYDTSNNDACDTTWNSAGTNTNAGLSGLSKAATYYWQVRATNSTDMTYADGGTWWSFSTIPNEPATFAKTEPANGAANQAVNPTLSWEISSGASSYEYCYSTSIAAVCDSSWISTGTNTSIALNGLSKGITYYWQVRAINTGGTTYANGGTWWSFSTIPDPPGAFVKESPTSNATGQSTTPTLSWNTSNSAASYEYCYDTVNNASCDAAWASTGANTSVGLTGLSTGMTYYWQVRAVNFSGVTYADSSTWWAFTTLSTFGDVPSNHWAWQYVERLYRAGITGGCGGGDYCPDTAVTRDQMAIFLLRGKHGNTYTPPPATGTLFTDVAADYWAAPWIEALANEGITGGCGGGKYCPGTVVTRDQMAVFLLRARNGNTYTPPPATGTMFSDVSLNFWSAAWIEALANEGITGGCGGGNYCPSTPVNRAQMAVFLVAAFSLP